MIPSPSSKTLSNPADSTHVLASVDRLTGVLRLSDSGNWNLLGFPTTLENIDLDNDGRDNDGDGFYDGDDTNGEGGIIAVRYGINRGGQGLKNFSIVADPNDPSVFYVGGDRQPHGDDEISGSQSSIDADTSSNAGRLFRGVVDATGALVEWQPITHTATTNNSAPHADSRDMVIDSQGNILQADDGGIYQLDTSISFELGGIDVFDQWNSLNGDLRITEVVSTVFDSGTELYLVGTQDNGNLAQKFGNDGLDNDGDGLADEFDETLLWQTTARLPDGTLLDGGWGDGNTQVYAQGSVDRIYQIGNNINTIMRIKPGDTPDREFIALEGLNEKDLALDDYIITPMVVNAFDGNKFMIGSYSLYLGSGDLDTKLTEIIKPGDNDTTFSAIAYGGKAPTGSTSAELVDVFYAARGDTIYAGKVTDPPRTFTETSIDGAVHIKDIAMDPDDWTVAWAITDDALYRTTDAGVAGIKLELRAQEISLQLLQSTLRRHRARRRKHYSSVVPKVCSGHPAERWNRRSGQNSLAISPMRPFQTFAMMIWRIVFMRECWGEVFGKLKMRARGCFKTAASPSTGRPTMTRSRLSGTLRILHY